MIILVSMHEGLDRGSGIHYSLKIYPKFISLKFWVNKTNYSLTVKMWHRNLIIHYSLILQFIKQIGLFIFFQPSIFTIHYFLANFSLSIIKRAIIH